MDCIMNQESSRFHIRKEHFQACLEAIRRLVRNKIQANEHILWVDLSDLRSGRPSKVQRGQW